MKEPLQLSKMSILAIFGRISPEKGEFSIIKGFKKHIKCRYKKDP